MVLILIVKSLLTTNKRIVERQQKINQISDQINKCFKKQ